MVYLTLKVIVRVLITEYVIFYLLWSLADSTFHHHFISSLIEMHIRFIKDGPLCDATYLSLWASLKASSIAASLPLQE